MNVPIYHPSVAKAVAAERTRQLQAEASVARLVRQARRARRAARSAAGC